MSVSVSSVSVPDSLLSVPECRLSRSLLSAPNAAERREKSSKGLKDFYLKAQTRIWNIFKRFEGLWPDRPGQHLVCAIFADICAIFAVKYVPYLLDSRFVTSTSKALNGRRHARGGTYQQQTSYTSMLGDM